MTSTLKHIFDQYYYDSAAQAEVLPGQWVDMSTIKAVISKGAGNCEPVSSTRAVAETETQQVIMLTVGAWVTKLVTLPEPVTAARPKSVQWVVDPDTAYAITKHCKMGDGRQFLGVAPGGSVYYTNGHYLLRQGAPDAGIAGAKCLDFGGKRVKKCQGVAAEYTSLTMPDCERVMPKVGDLLPGIVIDSSEVDRLYKWYKVQTQKCINTLTHGGLYRNGESGDAEFNIVFKSSYNLEYIKAVSDWVGPGALWAENKGRQKAMVVTSHDRQRVGVIMPVRD